MAVADLSAEEKLVNEARGTSRPRRHLQVWAIVMIALLLAAGAVISYIKTGGRQQVPMNERAGTKADASAKPSTADYQALVLKQTGTPTAIQSATSPALNAETAASPLSAATGSSPGTVSALLPPPPPPLTEAQIKAISGARLDGGNPQPNIAPIDLSANQMTAAGTYTGPSAGQGQPGNNSASEARQAEAAYMTAATDVYVRNRPSSSSPANRLLQQVQSAAAPLTGDVAASRLNALTSGFDPAALSKVGQKPDADQRINARLQQNQSFASNPVKPKEPLQATAAPNLPYVAEGDTIPAVLTRAIATDLPGQIEARVTSDVYDSFGRGITLIPKGTRVIGLYNSSVAVGQDRLQAVFTRLIFPSGASLMLDNSPGADQYGASGVAGEVNNHFFRIFSTALAVAAISYAVERKIAKDSPQNATGSTVNVLGSGAAPPGTVAAQTFGNVSERILDRTSSIGPTITVKSGTRIQIQITRDLAIDPRLVN